MNIWKCKIGESGFVLPEGDMPMRQAVAKAYKELTGVEPGFILSGWGAELTEPERAVVENREPSEKYRLEWERQRDLQAALEAANRRAAALREALEAIHRRLEHPGGLHQYAGDIHVSYCHACGLYGFVDAALAQDEGVRGG